MPEADTDEDCTNDYIEHDCTTAIDKVTKPRLDLQDVPIAELPLCKPLCGCIVN